MIVEHTTKSIYMKLFFIIFLGCFTIQSHAQKTLEDLLKQYNTHEIPYISVQELAMPKTNAVIFDARELEEYEVSHLKNAIAVGYENFDLKQAESYLSDKQQTIVVYCSLGIRSENIAIKLQKAGYANVYNLYGGIFEWTNKEFPIFNSEEKQTENVHIFSKPWKKWLTKGNKILP